MNDKSYKEDTEYTYLFIAGILLLIIMIDWYFLFFGYHIETSIFIKTKEIFIKSFSEYMILVRIGFVFLLFGHYWMNPVRRKRQGIKPLVFLATFIICMYFILGTIDFFFYDLVIYPLLSLATIFFIMLSSSFFKKVLKDESIFGISNEPALYDIKYTYETEQGTLGIHSAEQHIMIQGGSGSGKGGSIIEPTIHQHIFKELPAVIYDVKPELPLTHVAYTSIMQLMEKNNTEIPKVSFKVFNISNHYQSFRVNPLDLQYISLSDTPFLIEILSSFLQNFNADWRGEKGKKDHWYNASLAIWQALAVRFLEDEKLKYKLNFPILIDLIMTDKIGNLFSFIRSTPIAKKMFSAIELAAKLNTKQSGSEFSSAMSGLGKLVYNENLYWLLSANEINLDINNKDNKTILCIGGNYQSLEVYTPFIATILGVCMKHMREKEKCPMLFQLDEVNTVYLERLASDANLFRSNKVCLQMANQAYTMFEDSYGVKKANNLFGACGNQFFGMSNENTSSEIVEKMLGTVKKVDISYSSSDTGNSSTESLKEVKAMKIREVYNQKRGHFTGKIANGNPAFFSTQFQRFKLADDIIPLPDFVAEAYNEIDKEISGYELLDEQVSKNFENIQSLAHDILNAYPDYFELNKPKN